MPNLSLYVGKNDTHYINTVSLKILPLESDEETLFREGFLAGQEMDAIEETVLKPPADLTLQIISTWECQLRCHHCFSHRRLVKKQDDEVNVPALANFVKRFDERYPVKKTINFLGGEPSLKVDLNLRIMDAIRSLDLKGPLRFSMSTNLVKDLTENDFKFMSQLNALQVSVDGTKVQHNDQRKVFLPYVDQLPDAYEQTMKNAKKLLERNIDFQISCAVNQEKLNVKDKVEFFRNMLEAGIPFNRILYGHYFFTDHAKAEKPVLVPLVNPCCTFRNMRFIAVEHEHNLVADFYNNDGQLGTLHDDLDTIEANYKKFIMGRLPVLSDPVCMKCPYIGQCWGGCIGATYSKHSPSKACDEANIRKVHERRQFIINHVNEWYQKEEESNDWNSHQTVKC